MAIFSSFQQLPFDVMITLLLFIQESQIPTSYPNSNKVLEFDEAGILETDQVFLLNLDQTRSWSRFARWSKRGSLKLIKPETFHGLEIPVSRNLAVMKVLTLKEEPYIYYDAMDPKTKSCPATSVPCQLSPLVHLEHADIETIILEANKFDLTLLTNLGHDNNDSWVCCSGFCIDLLKRLATDVGFKFEIYEVKDRKWGGLSSGQWNGLVRALIDGEADLVMTSLKVNRDRSEAIDFSVTFLETGITTLVSVREVGTSATAFLEPFSPDTWLAILVGLINICAFAMFVFEYFSIVFLKRTDRNRNPCHFSPFSSIWLSWSMLFKAMVKVETPKSIAAKMMTCIWGMFCVIFASFYMANLAVFMITKEDYYDFSGLEDRRFHNPLMKNPPWRFATINHGATETFLKQNYPEMFDYMRQYNTKTVEDGATAVRNGTLDAFIYDAKVLEFKAGRERECKLRIVGKWYSTTGYAIGFPKGSKWVSIFDKFIIDYQHNGFIQQLEDFWLTGDCQRYKKKEKEKSYQLGVVNFNSAFVLLIFGLLVCAVLLIFENVCFERFQMLRNCEEGSTLWDKAYQRVRHKSLPHLASQPGIQDVFPPAIVRMCNNCGGRGHFQYQCSSPDMKVTKQLQFVSVALNGKDEKHIPNYGSTLQREDD